MSPCVLGKSQRCLRTVFVLVALKCERGSSLLSQITAGTIWPVWGRKSSAPSCLWWLLTPRRRRSRGPTTPPLDWPLGSSPGYCGLVLAAGTILDESSWCVLALRRAEENNAEFLPAGTFLEPTAWLPTWRPGPASSTTTTSALLKCLSEDTSTQVWCVAFHASGFLSNRSRDCTLTKFVPTFCQALEERTVRWPWSTTPSWRPWWWRWAMWTVSSELLHVLAAVAELESLRLILAGLNYKRVLHFCSCFQFLKCEHNFHLLIWWNKSFIERLVVVNVGVGQNDHWTQFLISPGAVQRLFFFLQWTFKKKNVNGQERWGEQTCETVTSWNVIPPPPPHLWTIIDHHFYLLPLNSFIKKRLGLSSISLWKHIY